MQEDFLHYVWQHKKFALESLQTTEHEPILIHSVGQPNPNSGPDFFNAQLQINSQLWAGNVEIHLKSSDWYAHHHHTDPTYDNVILHVVWEHNTEIFRKDNSVIPTFELRNVVSKVVFNNYQTLLHHKSRWIPCEPQITSVDSFIISHWLERLYLERLEDKYQFIEKQLLGSKQDWEATLFCSLLKSFGLKVNGEAFYSLAQSIDFKIIKKHRDQLESLEALLFGQSGLLQPNTEEPYARNLLQNYRFLKTKYKLNQQGVLPLKFFRLRPPNFPTTRLAQIAHLYHQQPHLFSKIIEAQNLEDLHAVFSSSTSTFWDTHYTFDKTSKSRRKTLSKEFINLLIINTVLPLKFAYNHYNRQYNHEDILKIAQQLPSENNRIINRFNSLIPKSVSALESQALLQLKSKYCDLRGCMKCAVGSAILNS